MLDIKWIRDNYDQFTAELSRRGVKADLQWWLDTDRARRDLIVSIHKLQESKNAKSELLGKMKQCNTREFETGRAEVVSINQALDTALAKLELIENELGIFMDNLPNLLDSSVPFGIDETANVFLRSFLEPTQIQAPKEHCQIGKELGMMDFEQTAKISGSRFVTLTQDLAKLERALINFMIDLHVKRGFNEVSPPALVKPSTLYNTGQLPKFTQDSYITSCGEYRLIPTAEVPLTNLVADMILAFEELPLRFVAYTPCFRSEAGSAGKDTKGMIRNHQFGKVELVTIADRDSSENEHLYMLDSAEEVLKQIGIPYRIMLLCSGDTGFAAKKTYDIEVWFPAQNRYREISSVSNCGDFQARRMRARYKDPLGKNNIFVHTLNGSALAVGRTIAAILENFQSGDTVNIPEVLRPYMGNQYQIRAK